MIARLFRSKQLDRIERSLGEAFALLEHLSRKVATMAHEQDDLNAAVAALTTAVSTAVDEMNAETQKILDALKAQTPTGVDPNAVEAAANSINMLSVKLKDAVSTAQAALAPAAPATAPSVTPADAPAAPQPAAAQPAPTA